MAAQHANQIWHELLEKCEFTSLMAEVESLAFQVTADAIIGDRDQWEQLRRNMLEPAN